MKVKVTYEKREGGLVFAKITIVDKGDYPTLHVFREIIQHFISLMRSNYRKGKGDEGI